MSKYHVKCEADKIYAGEITKSGKYKDRSDVTGEAISAVAQHILQTNKHYEFTYNGITYVLEVNEVRDLY